MAPRMRLDAREYCGRARRPQYRIFAADSVSYDGPMRTAVMLIGAAMVVGGLIWLAQGLNLPFAPRSFMTSDRSWALIGAVVVVAGIAVIGWARRAP